MSASNHHGVAPGPRSADTDLTRYLRKASHAIKFEEVPLGGGALTYFGTGILALVMKLGEIKTANCDVNQMD